MQFQSDTPIVITYSCPKGDEYMKKFVGVFLALLLILGFSIASASNSSVSMYPESVEVFELSTGQVCVYSVKTGLFECYCSCEAVYEYQECEQCQECEECQECQECEKCEPKPDKKSCNAGGGNGSELYWDGEKWVDCDPGNSGKNNNADD